MKKIQTLNEEIKREEGIMISEKGIQILESLFLLGLLVNLMLLLYQEVMETYREIWCFRSHREGLATEEDY